MTDKEKDEFWDIGKLLPKKSVKKGAMYDTSSIDVSADENKPLSSEQTSYNSEERRLTAADVGREKEEPKLLHEYYPDNAFIKKVSVYTSPSPYRYYEDFERTMHKYLRLTVKEAERVPFFSYVPQYSQLSKQRLSWYLYWRSLCRRREYVQTDLSYIMLYVYELLNFDNPKHPDRIIEELCFLWRAYRTEHAQLDRYLPDWVCDYCLIHALELPSHLVSDFIYDTLDHSSLKGFYYGSERGGSDAYTWGMICAASLYNYKKSKYYTDEHREMFDTHIKAAVSAALTDKLGSSSCEEHGYTLQKRDVYVGALCTSTAKRTVYIEHIPFTQSHFLRSEATLAVKHAENRLRAVLGIKSRLSVSGVSSEIKEKIDGYFAERFGKKSLAESRRGKEEPEYMAYYDSQTHGVEFGRAENIEKASWETAALMCESFDGDDAADELCDDISLNAPTEEKDREEHGIHASEIGSFEIPSQDGAEISLDACEREVLGLLLIEKSREAEALAASHGRFLSAVCERINEAALDIISDIVIEQTEGGYCVLSDYEEEVREWLKG